MNRNIYLITFLILLLFGNTPAQVLTISSDQREEESAEVSKQEDEAAKERREQVREQSLQFLRETITEVSLMRTVENRVSFTAELAGLLWKHDQTESRRLFGEVTDDFIELLIDANNLAVAASAGEKSSPGPSFQPAFRRLYQAMSVRQSIAMSMAERDAELAFDFVLSTASIITEENSLERIGDSDSMLFSMIIERMEVEDVDKAIALGKKMLDKQFSSSIVSLLRKVREKDEVAARPFARDIISSARRHLDSKDRDLSELSAPLKDESWDEDEPQLFEESDLKSYAEAFGNEVLKDPDISSYRYSEYAALVAPYSPDLARKIEEKAGGGGKEPDFLEAMKEAAQRAADAVPGNDETDELSASIKGDDEDEPELSPLEKLEKLNEAVDGEEELSDEDKKRFISEAYAIVSAIDDVNSKIVSLGALAAKVKQLGDDSLANEIMREARALVPSSPVNYMEFLQLWLVAGGYANVAPNESFAIIEDMIFRVNGTVGAFVTIAEFIDTEEFIIRDGEFQIGAFGGGMIRGILGALAGSENTVSKLASADFNRTKALAEKFDRPEARVMARMMILRAVMGE